MSSYFILLVAQEIFPCSEDEGSCAAAEEVFYELKELSETYVIKKNSVSVTADFLSKYFENYY